jgi:hypothetical protein
MTMQNIDINTLVNPQTAGDPFVQDALRQLQIVQDAIRSQGGNVSRQNEQQWVIALQRLKIAEGQVLERAGLTRQFTQAQQRALTQQTGLAQRQATQALTRTGGFQPGLEARIAGQVQAAGAQALAGSVGEFTTRLLGAQQQERAAFRSGAFAFQQGLFNKIQDVEFQEFLMKFQQQLQDNPLWQDLLFVAAESAGRIGAAYAGTL